MKNRLIYGLVGLMVVSLAGIIVLQSVWVSKAISEQEKEFENSVNTALNAVNSTIDEEEALFYLEDELGKSDKGQEVREIHSVAKDGNGTSEEKHFEISINHSSSEGNSDINVESNLPIEEIEGALNEFHLEMQETHKKGDSMILITKEERNKYDKMTTVVRRYVMGHEFSGNLTDRISKATLGSIVRKEFVKQGIKLRPEFAVYRAQNKEIIPEFTTKAFDSSAVRYKKALFPNDLLGQHTFELNVQFEGTNGLVWSGIQSIVLMCILFTLLILTCFGYSLHFIFKQKRMSQVKNDFINNMTHELKTPLASISLAAASIQHPNVIENPNEIQRFIGIIRSEERRMNEHVERVLDMAALDSQELKMQRESVDLIELIHESLEHIQLAVDASNGSVKFTTELKTVVINADKFHLMSALINILDNSVKYQNENLDISIILSEVANGYELEFADNGIGMKKTSVKRAFDKFFREETGNIHTRKGFGLGLSYVKSIIEAHEGTISLTSEPDRGTTVRIEIPKS